MSGAVEQTEIAGAAGLGQRLAPPLLGIAQGLWGALSAERDRWFLWLPAFLGVGIGIYFSLTVEPPLWLGLVLAATAILGVAIARWRERGIAGALAVAAVAVGFAAAEIETWAVATPVLERPTGRVTVEGRVIDVEPLPAGRRILLEPRRIGQLPREVLPARVRITIRNDEGAAIPGEGISVRPMLFPPSGPAMPGAYDFQRRAYFDRLGGVGYAQGPMRTIEGEPPATWRAWLAALRAAVSERIMAALPGRTGGIAAAIIAGETHAIPEADAQAFRDAGLAHILVIAGLHMGLVAGLAFFAVRAGLALVPWVALRFNTKKGAAVAALLVTFCYMLLSGATVSSRRSFIMTTLVLLAILLDRLHLSARGLAWAALAIMLASPYSVTTAGFQMSFAAVAGLVAFYETFRERIGSWYRDAGFVRRWGLHLLGIVFTTVVSTIATTPFTVLRFNHAIPCIEAKRAATETVAICHVIPAFLVYLWIARRFALFRLSWSKFGPNGFTSHASGQIQLPRDLRAAGSRVGAGRVFRHRVARVWAQGLGRGTPDLARALSGEGPQGEGQHDARHLRRRPLRAGRGTRQGEGRAPGGREGHRPGRAGPQGPARRYRQGARRALPRGVREEAQALVAHR